MATPGDGNAGIRPIRANAKVDYVRNETQPFDSQSPSLQPSGEFFKRWDDDKFYLNDTVPFEDNVSVEDAIDTQVMDFAGETQVLNLARETQVLNLARETQVLNLTGETQVMGDLDYVETQILDEFHHEIIPDIDGEGSDETEVLDDTEKAFDDGSSRRGNDLSSDREKIQHTSPCEDDEKETTKQSDALMNGRKSTGLKLPTAMLVDRGTPELQPGSAARFTSIRTASCRASGLAARNAASKGTNSGSCSVLTNCHSSDQYTMNSKRLESKAGEEVDQLCHSRGFIETIKGLRDGTKTARKLFTEDSLMESERSPCDNNNVDGGDDMLQFPSYDGELGGLSYIDSQEPGEASQANALSIVEQFINDHCTDLDNEDNHGKTAGGKSGHISSAKGPQNFAKNRSTRTTVAETGIFDWDDNREDEGGGDLFCRRKKDLLGIGDRVGKSVSLPQKPKGKGLGGLKDNKELLNDHDDMIAHSDSRLILHKLKESEKNVQAVGKKPKRKLVNDLDDQFNIDASIGLSNANSTKANMSEMLDVGVDTQMAAEAMEALFYGEGVDGMNDNGVHEGLQNKSKVYQECSLIGKQLSPGQQKCPSDIVGPSNCKRTKRADAMLMKDLSVHKRPRSSVDCGIELVITKTKRTRSNAEAHFPVKCSENMNKMPSKITKQRKKVGALESSLHDNSSGLSGHSLVKNHHIKEDSPIAHRTRYSMIQNQLEKDDNVSSYPRRRRSCRNMSGKSTKSDNSGAQSKLSALHEEIREPIGGYKRSRNNNVSSNIDSTMRRKPQLFQDACPELLQQRKESLEKERVAADNCNDTTVDGRTTSTALTETESPKHSERGNLDSSPAAKKTEATGRFHRSAKGNGEGSHLVCNTPDKSFTKTTLVNSATPVNIASPICGGEEYCRQSRENKLSGPRLMKEIIGLTTNEPLALPLLKESRKRRNLSDLKVLFSHHLDEDVIKQQKKILSRLGISLASSIMDATHFIADTFVRTRNMLEAIAAGKPVVTPLWIESIGQVKIHIDEESYILRDTKKEKDLGFKMSASLARARHCPLLQGRKVLVTPNTKPCKETISTLVKAVKGLVVERIGRSVLKDDKVLDDFLVLSCEEDYDICAPFLERGASVYSSELLLNGIVTQKLECERHRLFADHVKRTRSTIWVKSNGGKFLPVTNNKK